MNCEHKFVHLDTIKRKIDEYPSYGNTYIRIDTFYCEKCLETKEVKKEKYVGYRGSIPDWY